MSSPDVFAGAMAAQPHPHHGGSHTPVIVVLVFIAVLTAASVAVGELFVGSRGRRRTGYDLEAYVERKFAVCLGIEPVRAVRPARRRKKKACLPELGDGAEEVEPSDAAPKDDDKESGSSQRRIRIPRMGIGNKQ